MNSTVIIIIGLLLFVAGITIIILTCEQSHTGQGNCYDDKGNKINELTCEVVVVNGQVILVGCLVAIVGGILLTKEISQCIKVDIE